MSPPPVLAKSVADQDAVRAHNLRLVAGYVRERQPTTRGQVSAALGLNKATVSSLVAELIARGLVEDGGRVPGQRPGRPATELWVDRSVHLGLVVEVLAEDVVVGAWTLALEQLSRRSLGIQPRTLGAAATLREIGRALAAELDPAATSRRPVGVVVALPGLLDTRTGVLEASEPLGWDHVAVQEGLRVVPALAGIPMHVARIANLATIAELGSLASARDAICLHAGDTGIGAGVITGGRLLAGSRGRAGELRFVDPAGHDDTSSFGVASLLRSSGTPTGRLDLLHARLTARDTRSTAALEVFAGHLAYRLAALVALLDPETIVLAGQLAGLHPYLEPQLRQLIAHALTPRAIADLAITAGRYGADAAQVGGADLLADAAFDAVLANRPQRRWRSEQQLAAGLGSGLVTVDMTDDERSATTVDVAASYRSGSTPSLA